MSQEQTVEQSSSRARRVRVEQWAGAGSLWRRGAAGRDSNGDGTRPREGWLLPQFEPGLTTFRLEFVSWLECGPPLELVCSLQRPNGRLADDLVLPEPNYPQLPSPGLAPLRSRARMPLRRDEASSY